VDYKIIIPSFDRPEILCTTTLSLLRYHKIDLTRVAVFVSPDLAPGQIQPEWFRYMEAFRKHGFLEVQLHPGGHGLTGNMDAALRWVGKGYFITMSDRVSEILMPVQSQGRRVQSEAAPVGMLSQFLSHGYDLLVAGKFTAWSLNPSHNPFMLRSGVLSCRLGLLDGNLSGCILPERWENFAVSPGHGLIYDVEWSARLWDAGYRSVRYMGFCVRHSYRSKGGQCSLHPDASMRRLAENRAIKALVREFPKLVAFVDKPAASKKTMLYSFLPGQEKTLAMEAPKSSRGRPLRRGALRAASVAERKRRQRNRSHLIHMKQAGTSRRVSKRKVLKCHRR
jgi:hypothetical protein